MFHNYSYNDKSEKHSFDINEVDLSIVNGIRRTILTDIPVVGFIGEDEPTIEIIANNGPLHNEILIHRIGLIPLYINNEETENYVDNDMEFELNIENTGNELLNVTTNHFTGTNKGIPLTKKELSEIFPVNAISKSHILITRLRSEEHLHVKAKAVKRTARLNASFSPVSLSNFYFNQDQSKITKDTNILDKERTYYKNKYNEPTSIRFELESLNKLSLNYLFNKSFEIIIDKLNVLRNNLMNDITKIEKFQELDNTYEFHIENEDDTLGNIIQSLIHNRCIRDNKKTINDVKCLYIGYICPHPLKYLMVLRLTLENQTNIKVFNNFLESNCAMIIEELSNIKREWNSFKF